MKFKVFAIAVIALFLLAGCGELPQIKTEKINRFSSGAELVKAFEDARSRDDYFGGIYRAKGGVLQTLSATAETAASALDSSGAEYSETNVQVKGVDEADIIKTDGKYIYIVSMNSLIIAEAYPAENSKILSKTQFENFYPTELFIDNDKLLVFGNSNYQVSSGSGGNVGEPVPALIVQEKMIARPDIYPMYNSFTTLKLYDISNREEPELLKTFDFEGNYLTSRKIGEYVYFVLNSYPHFYNDYPRCEEIVPLYRETLGNAEPSEDALAPIAKCTDIGYIEPIQAENFITVASISMNDLIQINKEVIIGSGQNVYASLENLYVAQTTWPRYDIIGKLAQDYREKTVVTKFNLNNGNIKYEGTGEVNGRILNQFSMDEYDGNFRIATTTGEVWNTEIKSMNNVYVMDKDLNVVGKLEELAPGESIYSVRFMGKRGYVVTFKKIDPLFVIDLSDPTNPNVLGKLKIPGYSDYLHPYDETHLIGIGKEAVDAESSEGMPSDFAWYQGVKMAIFDVSDVENPIEMHKVVIGDRGTDSEALHEHKAFLFDKEKNLLVLPITLAEIKGDKTDANQYGETTFQGAYVYDVTLENGFNLKGRVSHYENEDVYLKSGYYFYGNRNIRRSLYIGNVLYTLSNEVLQLNDLNNLDKINSFVIWEQPYYGEPVLYEDVQMK